MLLGAANHQYDNDLAVDTQGHLYVVNNMFHFNKNMNICQ